MLNTELPKTARVVKTEWVLPIFLVVVAFASCLCGAEENKDEQIKYKGEIWYNYSFYHELYYKKEREARQDPAFDSRGRRIRYSPIKVNEILYKNNLKHFFWDCELGPSFPRKRKTYYGRFYEVFLYRSVALRSFSKPGDVLFGKQEVKKIYGEVYGNSGETDKDGWLRGNMFKKTKPKVRIFAMLTMTRFNKKKYFVTDHTYQLLDGKYYWFRGEHILRLDPKQQARELWLKGCKLMEEDNYKEAIERFQEAKKKAPDYAPPYYRLGVCYNELGDAQKALENYSKYLKLIEGKPKKEKIRNKVQQSVDRLKSSEQE